MTDFGRRRDRYKILSNFGAIYRNYLNRTSEIARLSYFCSGSWRVCSSTRLAERLNHEFSHREAHVVNRVDVRKRLTVRGRMASVRRLDVGRCHVYPHDYDPGCDLWDCLCRWSLCFCFAHYSRGRKSVRRDEDLPIVNLSGSTFYLSS